MHSILCIAYRQITSEFNSVRTHESQSTHTHSPFYHLIHVHMEYIPQDTVRIFLFFCQLFLCFDTIHKL